MTTLELVRNVIDEALNLQGRSRFFSPETPLLGSLPELDSMAVLALVSGLESRFDIVFPDDQLNASVFATVGSLSRAVDEHLKTREA
ncbi:MAG: acyl carrier protein [Comamonadaceae bacterium]|nr:acyl carrier protein [Comamonadaceae bacterium]